MSEKQLIAQALMESLISPNVSDSNLVIGQSRRRGRQHRRRALGTRPVDGQHRQAWDHRSPRRGHDRGSQHHRRRASKGGRGHP